MEHRVTYQKGVIGVDLRRKRALLMYLAGENHTFKVADAGKALENRIGGGIIRFAVIRSVERDFWIGIHTIDKIECNVLVCGIVHHNIIHAHTLQQGIEPINTTILEQCFQIALVITKQLRLLYGVKCRVVHIAIMLYD